MEHVLVFNCIIARAVASLHVVSLVHQDSKRAREHILFGFAFTWQHADVVEVVTDKTMMGDLITLSRLAWCGYGEGVDWRLAEFSAPCPRGQ